MKTQYNYRRCNFHQVHTMCQYLCQIYAAVQPCNIILLLYFFSVLHANTKDKQTVELGNQLGQGQQFLWFNQSLQFALFKNCQKGRMKDPYQLRESSEKWTKLSFIFIYKPSILLDSLFTHLVWLIPAVLIPAHMEDDWLGRNPHYIFWICAHLLFTQLYLRISAQVLW